MSRVLSLTAILALGTGCVERFMSIRSEPEGATCTVDGQKVGETPVEVPFTWYGGREIVLEKEGYETLTHLERLNAPWWQFPPFDLITDVLLSAFTLTDRHEFTYKLKRIEIDPADLEEVKKRADELRKRATEPPK